MLVLTRKVDESIVIVTPAGPVTIRILAIRAEKAKIGIQAPSAIGIARAELLSRATLVSPN